MLFLMLAATSSVILAAHPREDIEIRNVDVGQGDCALIWGDDIPVIMIDGGSSSIKQVGSYRIVPVLKANRIGSIDCCFLTHMDSDHVSGVLEMLEDELCPVRIKKVIVSAASAKLDGNCENMQRLQKAADNGRTKVVTISAGDTVSAGNIRIRCLSPPDDMPSSAFDANDASLVLDIRLNDRRDFSALFTGDISENTERQILNCVDSCTYLKVAHHGSATSTCTSFLDRTRPKIGAISAGIDNPYGHPTRQALERLAGSGVKIYRTDQSGEIIFSVSDGMIRIRTIR